MVGFDRGSYPLTAGSGFCFRAVAPTELTVRVPPSGRLSDW